MLHSQDPNAFDDKITAEVSDLGCRLAPAVESAARYLRGLRQEKFAQALDRTSKALTSTLDIQQVLETVCRECCTMLEVTYGILSEVEGEELVCRAVWPAGAPQTYVDGFRLSLKGQATNVATRVAFNRQPEIINEPPDHPHSSAEDEFSAFNNVKATMCVPLLARDQVVGVLELAHVGTGRKFTRCCLQMAEAFAAHAALALENDGLREQFVARSNEIAAADEIAQIITSTLNINEVYDRFAAEVKKLVGFDQINISVINADDRSLTVKYISGLTQPGRRAGEIIPLSGTETERAAKSRQSFITQDLVGNITCISVDALLKAGLRSRMLVPVSWEGQVIGTITLHSCRVGGYGPREQALLERLAQQIAPVVENARLYEEILKEREHAAGLLAQLKAVLAEADAGLLLVNGQEQVLRHSESLQRALLAAIPDALFRISKDGTYLSYLAPAGFQPLIPSEEFLRETVVSVMPAEVAQPAMDCIAKALSSGQVQTFEYRLQLTTRPGTMKPESLPTAQRKCWRLCEM